MAQQRQDVDGGRDELGDELLCERGGHATRGRIGCVGFDSGDVSDGAPGLLAVQGVGEGPQRCGQVTDRAAQGECETRPEGGGAAEWGRRSMRAVSTSNPQVRSLEAAGKPASSWKEAQVRQGPPLRQAQVAQGGTLTASLTEQSKLTV